MLALRSIYQPCKTILRPILCHLYLQVTYLDALAWNCAPCRPVVKALSSTLRKAPELRDLYRSLAKSTGEGPCILSVPIYWMSSLAMTIFCVLLQPQRCQVVRKA